MIENEIATEVRAETRGTVAAGRAAPHESPRVRTEDDLIVPLVDEQEAGRVYDPSIHRWALLGAFAGAVLLGWFGGALASGALPAAGLGQWAASGTGVGAFTGAGLGAAAGGLACALLALYRLPPRR